MDSEWDTSGVDQSTLEVSNLTGSADTDEGEEDFSVTLVAVVCCVLACIIAISITLLLFGGVEVFEDADSGGGGDGRHGDDVEYPTNYPPVDRSPPQPVVTERPTKKAPPSPPVAARPRVTRSPPRTPRPITTRPSPTIRTKPTTTPVTTTAVKKVTPRRLPPTPPKRPPSPPRLPPPPPPTTKRPPQPPSLPPAPPKRPPPVPISKDDIDDDIVALKALEDVAKVARTSGNSSYVILGALSATSEWTDYFKNKFKNTFKPDLFISLGHQLRGDPEKSRCIATPPAILQKPTGFPDEHDLHDAARALADIASQPDSPRISISVSMKGRWSTLKPKVKAEVFAPCVTSSQGPFYGSYTDVCNTLPFSNNLLQDGQRYAMRTYDKASRRMFVYDNEETLCKKLCLLKANYTKLEFGVAIYDLDYEDTEGTCSSLNTHGAYSRTKVASTVHRYFASQFTDPSKEAECSQLWRL
ncbi:uncharacterized protein [Dermacentor albipictus]|uniref:uncharacterized protein n=1 Tax=Dermacentor albipictus TaxID=60249 RepID=UPI0038FC31D6